MADLSTSPAMDLKQMVYSPVLSFLSHCYDSGLPSAPVISAVSSFYPVSELAEGRRLLISFVDLPQPFPRREGEGAAAALCEDIFQIFRLVDTNKKMMPVFVMKASDCIPCVWVAEENKIFGKLLLDKERMITCCCQRRIGCCGNSSEKSVVSLNSSQTNICGGVDPNVEGLYSKSSDCFEDSTTKHSVVSLISSHDESYFEVDPIVDDLSSDSVFEDPTTSVERVDTPARNKQGVPGELNCGLTFPEKERRESSDLKSSSICNRNRLRKNSVFLSLEDLPCKGVEHRVKQVSEEKSAPKKPFRIPVKSSEGKPVSGSVDKFPHPCGSGIHPPDFQKLGGARPQEMMKINQIGSATQVKILKVNNSVQSLHELPCTSKNRFENNTGNTNFRTLLRKYCHFFSEQCLTSMDEEDTSEKHVTPFENDLARHHLKMSLLFLSLQELSTAVIHVSKQEVKGDSFTVFENSVTASPSHQDVTMSKDDLTSEIDYVLHRMHINAQFLSLQELPTEVLIDSSERQALYQTLSAVDMLRVQSDDDLHLESDEPEEIVKSRVSDFVTGLVALRAARRFKSGKVSSSQEAKEPDKTYLQQSAAQLRSNVVNEILQTERDYVKHLEDIVEGYMTQMRRRPDMFLAEQIVKIFGNIAPLFEFQKRFLRDLEASYNQEKPDETCVGSCFLRHISSFEVYSDYCTQHGSAVAELQNLYANERTAHFLEACRLLRGMADIALDGFLLTPVQRICKYPLQLGELLKHTDDSHPDCADVNQALHSMREVATLINERKRKLEAMERLTDWQKLVENWQGDDLTLKSSELIYSGDLQKISHGGWAKDVTMYLFDRQAIICKKDLIKRNSLTYKARISTEGCESLPVPDGKDSQFNATVKFAFKVRDSSDRCYFFTCKTLKDRDKWLSAFARDRLLQQGEGLRSLPDGASFDSIRRLESKATKLVNERQRLRHIKNRPRVKKIDPESVLSLQEVTAEGSTIRVDTSRKNSWFSIGSSRTKKRVSANRTSEV